jgi:outer membrane protein TolC
MTSAGRTFALPGTHTLPGPRILPAIRALFVALALGGCATLSEDGGFADVQQLAGERLGTKVQLARAGNDGDAIAAQVQALLAKPLGVDDAVQIALLNNPGLQASYASLGIAEADLVQAGRLRNPSFDYLNTWHGSDRKLEWTLLFPIIDLATLPLRTKAAGRGFDRAKLEGARATVALAAGTRRAYFQAVAAQETARYAEQVKDAADASAELARRMARAGNFPKLTQMREQAFYAEAVAQLARARQSAVAERERLTRLMGLHGDERFVLPDRLPDLPAAPAEQGDAETVAMRQRLDVLAAQRETEAVAESLGLVKATRVINLFDLGPARTREGDEPWKTGFALVIEIPLFDWGSAKVARAEAVYMQSVQRVAETAVNARSEVRETYSAYTTAYGTARHYRDEIVPLRKRISEEQLLRYNGMLISVFELLADAREQVAAVNAAIDAARDFWVAEADLQAALAGAGEPRPAGARPATMTAAPARAGGH